MCVQPAFMQQMVNRARNVPRGSIKPMPANPRVTCARKVHISRTLARPASINVCHARLGPLRMISVAPYVFPVPLVATVQLRAAKLVSSAQQARLLRRREASPRPIARTARWALYR